MSGGLALLVVALAPAIWWWHRRARPTGDRPFSGFFLVVTEAGETGRGPHLRSPILLAIRLISLAFLAIAAAGLTWETRPGTLVLAAGPFTPDPQWPTPLTVVRAGQPPTVETGPVARVASPPAWGAALLFGSRVAPGAQVVRPPTEPAGVAFTSGGAALGGAGVVVTATLAGPGTPALEAGGRRWPLTRRTHDWVLDASDLPAGGAVLVVEGAEPWPVCLPDLGPLAVADTGWPPPVSEVFDLLGEIRRVPAGEADWRPGTAPPRGLGWAAFAPRTTTFELGAQAPTEGPAPLAFARRHPPPGAVARRWRPLDQPAQVLVFAGDAPVIDHGEGSQGAGVRFGFTMDDTDLPTTAGWPVLFADLLEATRFDRARCRPHEAGGALLVQADGPVELTDPAGTRRTLTPTQGRLALDGLDRQGLYRLASGGVEATIAVVPTLSGQPTEAPALAAPAATPDPVRWPWMAAGLLGLLAAVFLGRRLRAPLAWLAPLLVGVALVAPRLGGAPGQVVLAVDTSSSMPPVELAASVDVVLRQLPKDLQQIEGAQGVERVHAGGPPQGAGGDTRHQPLLTAAAGLAGPGGVVVLVSDGRALDGPVALEVPVVAVAVAAAHADGRVVSARALRLGPQIFVRASVAADRATPATVRLGSTAVPVTLGPTERSVQAVVPAGPTEIEVSVEVAGDPVGLNNRLPVPVEGGESPQAVVVGAGAVGFAESAGLAARELPAAALAEAGARLGLMRAMFIHDQPAAAFSPAVLEGLERWVAGGGVLVLSGHDAAFGPGGWGGTPLDALSPLRADPRPPGGAVAVALALDRSGSMATSAGGIGPEGVGALAAAIAGTLRDDDLLSVIAFAPDATSLLAPTTKKRLQIEGLQVPTLARGGTRLAPALELALRQLAGAEATERVVVVISDGQVVDQDALEPVVARLEAAGVRLVAVLTGSDPTREPLATLARRTGGSLVSAEQGAIERFATASVLGALGEGLFAPGGVVQPRAGWGARVGGQAPAVDHRVRVGAHPEARVLADVLGEPLLAEWAFGQGRVIALATDRWDLSPDQWAALLAPAGAPRPADARVEVEGELIVYTGLPTDAPPHGEGVLEGAQGTTRVRWHPTGPGRAVAPLPRGLVEVLALTTPTTRGAVQTRITRPPPGEVAATGPDEGALALQAEITGGLVARPAEVGAAVQALRGRRQGPPVAPWLLALAALALLLDTARWAGWTPRRPRPRAPG